MKKILYVFGLIALSFCLSTVAFADDKEVKDANDTMKQTEESKPDQKDQPAEVEKKEEVKK